MSRESNFVVKERNVTPPPSASGASTESNGNNESNGHQPFSRDGAFARALAALEAGGQEPAKEAPQTAPANAPDAPPGEVELSEAPPATSTQEGAPPAPDQRRQEIERWEALEVLERQNRERDEKYARERAEWERSREQERSQWSKELAAAAKMRAGDVLGALQEMGVSVGTFYDQLTKDLVGGKVQRGQAPPSPADLPPEIKAKLDKIDRFEAWQQEQEKERETRRAAEFRQRAIENTKSDLNTIDPDGKKFVYARRHPQFAEAVYNEVVAAWEQAGKPIRNGVAVFPLTPEQAAHNMNTFLRTIAVGPESQSGTEPAQQATQGTPLQSPLSPTAKRAPTRTLTNGMSAEVSRVAPSADPAECRRRALAAAEGLLSEE